MRRLGSTTWTGCLLLLVLGCDSNTPAAEEAPAAQAPAPAATAQEPAAAAAEDGTEPAPEPAAAAAGEAALADPSARAELGKAAPVFTLSGVDGQKVSLADLKGKTVVLEWFNPDCPFVKFAHTTGPLADQAKTTVGDDLVWLSVNSGAEGKQGHGLERNRAALGEYGMVNPVLLDPTGVVGKAYDAQKTPSLFVIDPAGILVYRGAIDNAPIGKVDPQRPRYPDSAAEEVVNYVRGALEDMKAERELRLPETPAYGCSVKYSS